MHFIWTNWRKTEEEMVIHGVPVVIEQEDLSFDDGIRVLTAVPLIVINANEESIGTLTDNLIAPVHGACCFPPD